MIIFDDEVRGGFAVSGGPGVLSVVFRYDAVSRALGLG